MSSVHGWQRATACFPAYHPPAARTGIRWTESANTGERLDKIRKEAEERRVRGNQRWELDEWLASCFQEGCCTGGVSILSISLLLILMIVSLRLTNGCSVRLLGDLVQSLGKGQDREFRVQSAEVIGQCNPDVWYQCFY